MCIYNDKFGHLYIYNDWLWCIALFTKGCKISLGKYLSVAIECSLSCFSIWQQTLKKFCHHEMSPRHSEEWKEENFFSIIKRTRVHAHAHAHAHARRTHVYTFLTETSYNHTVNISRFRLRRVLFWIYQVYDEYRVTFIKVLTLMCTPNLS